jgi:hypothetical protein
MRVDVGPRIVSARRRELPTRRCRANYREMACRWREMAERQQAIEKMISDLSKPLESVAVSGSAKSLHLSQHQRRGLLQGARFPSQSVSGTSGLRGYLHVSSWVKKRTDNVSNHKFKIGQAVFSTSGVGSSRRSDVFTVMQRLPPEDGDYQYRIKSAHEPFDLQSRRCPQSGHLALGCKSETSASIATKFAGYMRVAAIRFRGMCPAKSISLAGDLVPTAARPRICRTSTCLHWPPLAVKNATSEQFSGAGNGEQPFLSRTWLLLDGGSVSCTRSDAWADG